MCSRPAGSPEPFPIQTQTLPDTLAGRDVLGRGKTGSGKTLAFSIPMVAKLAGMRRVPLRPTGLLAPTRELASQITATLEPLAAANGLRVTTIFGGVPQGKQVSALKSGIDIVVACPGRLEDLIKQKLIHLDAIEITVIDEADHMADLGFLPGVTRILAATPSTGQRLLFSGDDGQRRRQARQPVHDRPGDASVDSANSPVSQMTHHVFHVPDAQAKRTTWSTGWRLGPAGESCSCGPSITPASSPNSSPNPVFRRWICTAIFAARTRQKPRCLQQWRCTCWWRPISPHAACTPTASNWWCTSTARGAQGVSAPVRPDRAPAMREMLVTVVLPTQRRDTAALMRRAGIRATPQEVTVDSAAVHGGGREAAPYQAPAPKVAAPGSVRHGLVRGVFVGAPGAQPFGTPSSIPTLRASSAAWCYGCPG